MLELEVCGRLSIEAERGRQGLIGVDDDANEVIVCCPERLHELPLDDQTRRGVSESVRPSGRVLREDHRAPDGPRDCHELVLKRYVLERNWDYEASEPAKLYGGGPPPVG